MATRRSFKSDVSFLEKISMGATGTVSILEDMRRQGHSPIELERGSTSFKIWKNIKIKRIRVPDILCVDCGTRVECRTKSKLEISMSHSQSDPERGWDFGLDNDDVVAFVSCTKSGVRPIDWKVSSPAQYVVVKDLREAYNKGLTVTTRPKGAQEGFELRIIWPASIASFVGVVKSIQNGKIQFEREVDKKSITLRLFNREKPLRPLIKEHDGVLLNQIVGSVVPIHLIFPCSKSSSESDYVKLLSSRSLTARYTGVKALASFSSADTVDSLLGKVNDSGEHIYVRLEAAADLARHGDNHGYDFVKECIDSEYLQNRLEAVIVLAEIKGSVSDQILMGILRDQNQHPEIRAGAAWALGELHDILALDALIRSFSEVEESIRVEAARALAKLARRFTTEIINRFPKASFSERPAISWALSKAGSFNTGDILRLLVDEDSRAWVAYIIGSHVEQKYIREVEQIRARDPEVYFAVTVLWKIMTSWVWGLEEY